MYHQLLMNAIYKACLFPSSIAISLDFLHKEISIFQAHFSYLLLFF